MLTLICVYILIMYVTRNYFRTRFLCWFETQNMELCMQLVGKVHNITYVIYKNILLFCNSVFPV